MKKESIGQNRSWLQKLVLKNGLNMGSFDNQGTLA